MNGLAAAAASVSAKLRQVFVVEKRRLVTGLSERGHEQARRRARRRPARAERKHGALGRFRGIQGIGQCHRDGDGRPLEIVP